MNKAELLRELRDKLVYARFNNEPKPISGILHHTGRCKYRVGGKPFTLKDVKNINMRVPSLKIVTGE